MKKLPLLASKKFRYTIYYSLNDNEDKYFVVKDDLDRIGSILNLSKKLYAINQPISFQMWESVANDDKKYTLILKNEDGTDISIENSEFITYLLSDGEYYKEFNEYEFGGLILGSVVVGVGALIAYWYSKTKKNKNANPKAKKVVIGNREYPIKDAWRREHTLENKSEKYEVKTADRKFAKGGCTCEHYDEIEYGEGGAVRAKDIITKKIGFIEENAEYLVSQSEKFSIWLADSILQNEMNRCYGRKYEDVDGVFGGGFVRIDNDKIAKKAFIDFQKNKPSFIMRNYGGAIRQILDWLQHPVTPKQDLRNLSFEQALEKSREWHNELQILGGDIDFIEPEKNVVLKKYPKNNEGIEYYWVFDNYKGVSLYSNGGEAGKSKSKRRKIRKTPKIVRTLFEEESYEYKNGGGVNKYYNNMSKEDILSKTIVYDNKGKSYDRYTVFTPDGSVFAMSEDAVGFNLYIGDKMEVEKGSHLGFKLKSVPKQIENAVLNRMIEDFKHGGDISESNVDGFNLVYEVFSKIMGGNGVEGTIRTLPQNYYVASIDGEGNISFKDLEGQTKNINKNEVKRLWNENKIPLKQKYEGGGSIDLSTREKAEIYSYLDSGDWTLESIMENFDKNEDEAEDIMESWAKSRGYDKKYNMISYKDTDKLFNDAFEYLKNKTGVDFLLNDFTKTKSYERTDYYLLNDTKKNKEKVNTILKVSGRDKDIFYFNSIEIQLKKVGGVFSVDFYTSNVKKGNNYSTSTQHFMKFPYYKNKYGEIRGGLRFDDGGLVENEINELYAKSNFINEDFNWQGKLLEMLQDNSVEAYNIYQSLNEEQKEQVLQELYERDNDMGSYGDGNIETSRENLEIILEDAKNGNKYAKGGEIKEWENSMKKRNDIEFLRIEKTEALPNNKLMVYYAYNPIGKDEFKGTQISTDVIKYADSGGVTYSFLHLYKLTYPDGFYIVESYDGEYMSPKEAMEKMRINIKNFKSYKYKGISSQNPKYKEWNERKDIGYSNTEAWDEVFENEKLADGGMADEKYVSPHKSDFHKYILKSYGFLIPNKEDDNYTYSDFADDIKKTYSLENPKTKKAYDYLKSLGDLRMFNSDDMIKVNNRMSEIDIEYKIKDWYVQNYPKDDLGEEMNDENTFDDLYNGISNGVDVYEIIGVGDSIIRERLFEYLAKIKGVDYEHIYRKWLDPNSMLSDSEFESMYADGGSIYAEGGRLTDMATYLSKRDIESIKTVFGEKIDGKRLLDGIYVKGKINKPKMSRTQFEEETFEYAEGGEVEDWMEEALEFLIEESGYDDLEITMVSDNGNEFYATSDDAEYRVFQTENDAEETAIEEVSQSLEKNPENFNTDWLITYIEASDFFKKELEIMNLRYAEDIKSEDDKRYANRLIAKMVDNGIMDEEEALSGNAEELSDYYLQDFVNLLTEDNINEGNDGFDYFVSHFDLEYTIKLISENNLINIDEASKDAVELDGVAHFISSYDGETVSLSNNFVAYRVNKYNHGKIN